MLCPNCNIYYEDPDMRFCVNCGKPLEGTAASSPPPDTTPRRRPRTIPPRPPETVVVQVGNRPRHVRRSYLLAFLVLLLLFLVCGCLMYTNILAAPIFLTDIFREYTRLGFGCLNGLLLLFIFYIIIIILKLDFNCIYVPIGLLIVMVSCVILNILGVVELPDFADRIVDQVTDPIRTLPLPWDPGPSQPEKPPDEKKPSGGCCPDFNFSNIYYDNGYLYSDINCRTESYKPQCAQGTVYDGAGNFWTVVSCCADPNYLNNAFKCEGLDYVTSKVGDVRLEMEYIGTDGRTCTIGANFPPPTYTKPPDQQPDQQPATMLFMGYWRTSKANSGGVCCYNADCFDNVCSHP